MIGKVFTRDVINLAAFPTPEDDIIISSRASPFSNAKGTILISSVPNFDQYGNVTDVEIASISGNICVNQ